SEYVKLPQVHTNETSSEWMKWIWKRLTYFRENNLLPNETICFSCNQLVYTGKQTKNIKNYNHIGIERHWASHCMGNSYCGYALHRYKLWESNTIKKIQHAKEVGKKIRAINIISQKWLEYFYRPEGICATELVQHYKFLWSIREEMRQINNI
ncbi:46262_t:CDS:2, partial [Gigaspora margarita]